MSGIRSVPLALALAVSACGPMRSSMIGLDGMRARSASFAVRADTIVVTHRDPMGGAMVLNDAYLDGDRVVLGALVTSSGGEATRTECVDVATLAPSAGWEQRLYWRGPDGELERIDVVVTGDEARAIAVRDCPPR